MTPEEKAKELVNKFDSLDFGDFCHDSKLCALIVVEEIVNELIDYGEESDELQNMDRTLNFWEVVKLEIEKI